jgi:hypothetical protein
MKFPLRIYGEICGINPAKRSSLSSLNEAVFHILKDRIKVEYEGVWLDIEEDLDVIVAALAEDGHGHVDYLDHDHWEILRYQLKPGKWTCKRVNVNNILEPLLKE